MFVNLVYKLLEWYSCSTDKSLIKTSRKSFYGLMSLLLSLIYCYSGTSQNLGVNSSGSAPHSSAGLDIDFSDRGTLHPRLTTDQRDAITSPAEGLLIYNTDCHAFNYYNGSDWVSMNGSTALANPGSISGNTSPCSGATGEVYSIAAVSGATGYNWSVPPGAAITSGQGSTSITVDFGSTSGDICVSANNDCYTSNASCIAINLTSGSISLSQLKAYYKFNEASGNLINEAGNVGSVHSLGSAADGTNTGVTYSAAGKIGTAYTYDGVTGSDKSQLGTSVSQFNFMHSNTATYTVALWFRKGETTTSTFRTILANHFGAGPQIGTRIAFYGTNRTHIQTKSGGTDPILDVGNTYAPADQNWHFMVVTLDMNLASNNQEVWLDGVLNHQVTKAAAGTSSNASLAMYIGDDVGGDGNWLGELDEMSIWNRVLTNSEIDYLYNCGNGREL